MAQGRLDLGVAERGQALASRASDGPTARLFSRSPPCFWTCRPTIASTAARRGGIEVAAVDE